MARSRRPFVRGRRKIKTNWVAGAVDTAHVPVAAGVATNVILYSPLVTSQEPVTVVRVVGRIHTFLQAVAPAVGSVVQMLIYRQGLAFTLDPSLIFAQDSEDVMWSYSHYYASASDVTDGVSFDVDIKTQRVLRPNETQLSLAFVCIDAFYIAKNLRVLLRSS